MVEVVPRILAVAVLALALLVQLPCKEMQTLLVRKLLDNSGREEQTSKNTARRMDHSTGTHRNVCPNNDDSNGCDDGRYSKIRTGTSGHADDGS